MNLIDLHCDTLYEAYTQQKSLTAPTLSVHLQEPIFPFERYLQIAAIWSDSRLSDDEAFSQCLRILDWTASDAFSNVAVEFVPEGGTRPAALNRILLSVEDARILNEDLSRLHLLYQRGVRFLTLLWKGKNCIGGGYDCKEGLTAFGKQVVHACGQLGVIPDISHASEASAWQILEESHGCPVIASHSNSFAVWQHPRNLSDSLFQAILQQGGLVGINLYTEHLGCAADDPDVLDRVLTHLEHYWTLGGTGAVCLGCDFDGAPTPQILHSPADLIRLAEHLLRRGYSDALVEQLFWKNADQFFKRHIFSKV